MKSSLTLLNAVNPVASLFPSFSLASRLPVEISSHGPQSREKCVNFWRFPFDVSSWLESLWSSFIRAHLRPVDLFTQSFICEHCTSKFLFDSLCLMMEVSHLSLPPACLQSSFDLSHCHSNRFGRNWLEYSRCIKGKESCKKESMFSLFQSILSLSEWLQSYIRESFIPSFKKRIISCRWWLR
jgi:hypothetical protein